MHYKILVPCFVHDFETLLVESSKVLKFVPNLWELITTIYCGWLQITPCIIGVVVSFFKPKR